MIDIKLYNNLKTLESNTDFKRTLKINNRMLAIIAFANMPIYLKKITNRLPLFDLISGVSTKRKHYVLKNKKKKYPFKVLSEEKIQKYDKKILTDRKNKNITDILRILKLACTMDLVNPKIIMCNTPFRTLDCIISFEEHGIEKIMDYSRNIIMTKEDYSEIFPFEEINTLTKDELYRIYLIISESENYNLLLYFLLFSKEMFNDINKNGVFKEVSTNADFNFSDINKKNYPIMGRLCDHLYFEDCDYQQKYEEEQKELADFTLNPDQKLKHITYSKKRLKYVFRNKKFGFFEFSLLSDFLDEEQIKDELLSKDRYHKCHINSQNILYHLHPKNRENALLVAGKIKINENNYLYHSWVEIDNKNIVIDYNHNLIMNRDKYYKLFEAVPIQKTTYHDLEKIHNLLLTQAGLKLTHLIINYFGQEMYSDLMRNQKIFEKK